MRGVETCRTVDLFVSRLRPETARSELADCINTVEGNPQVYNIYRVKLKSKYEDLYSSYHVADKVNSGQYMKTIALFSSAESWPVEIFVKRYFRIKDVTASA